MRSKTILVLFYLMTKKTKNFFILVDSSRHECRVPSIKNNAIQKTN